MTEPALRSEPPGTVPPSRGAGLAGWALGTAAVALIVAATSPIWGPLMSGDRLAVRIASAEQELARLGAALTERTDPLPARLAGLEQEFRAADQRIDELRRLALIGAIAQLRPALARPTPFALELAAVAGLAAGRAGPMAAVAVLTPHAATGIPTLRQIRARFDDYAMRTLMAEASTDDVPIVSQLVTWISATAPLGSGRFVLDLTMPSAATAVRAAAQRLEADDLDGALAVLSGLTGPAAEAMRPWIEQARARADATRALEQLVAAAAGGGR
ncbi:MAG: hypothetical protein IT561_19890 [Alphaproteobacteria bacterium]|nr:hypothetical protein [Alphaproteobacteria bacterium]